MEIYKITAEEWEEYNKIYVESRKNADDFEKDSIYNSIASIIPFKRRGKRTITTFEECKQAAINLGEYLS